MFALVDKSDNSITRMLNGNRGITIDDNQYPRAIFSLWSEAERNAINIYAVTIDTSKRKDEKWYTNTNITYTFSGGKVTGSYGDATARAHADTNKKDEDGNDLDPVVVILGLKSQLISDVKATAANELNKTDWYVVRKTEESTAIPSAVTTHRRAVRSKAAAMETSITNASDTPALETLYTSVDGDERPIGYIPVKNF